MRICFSTGILLLFTLSSCITILQGLITHDNIVTDSRLPGKWMTTDSTSFIVQKIMDSKFKPTLEELNRHEYTKADSLFFTKLYVLSFRENNLNYSWFAGIVKIHEQYYINLAPEDCLNDSFEEAYRLDGQSFLNTSSIAKLEWKNNNELSLNFLNGDKLKEIILNGNALIAYEYDPLFDSFVITASSNELEKFLEKYGDNEYLYKGGRIINLRKK